MLCCRILRVSSTIPGRCRTTHPAALADDLSSGMSRHALVFVVAIVTVLSWVSGPNLAHAGPPPPCSFTLSPPHVVQISGVNTVTATVAPDVCGPPATPAKSVACLQVQGGEGVTHSYPSDGSGSAQVFLEPVVPGATYVATGRGCSAWIGQPPAPDCQLLGPYSAKL